ncbi:hypothetical protein AKJ51_01425 [candidate division MSBL1 archaeon SCGC-AAA382A20]|uniref:ParB/Sulfiredoxin domain-containing protein n=1 Tax=candidate division MSBL1 archaeon SCGC-AAA382A20 TaxID=1698280 RepID=A0A133VLT9_9EURY|nr:hypothetical protein AKJ51_01425 [candidate division MSBL1 archaeon SCGC-AAA382A20]
MRGWFNQFTRHKLSALGIPTTLEPRTEEESWSTPLISESDAEEWETWSHETRKYFLPTTGMSAYYDMRNHPDYHREKKGWDFDIVLMNPNEYEKYVKNAILEIKPDANHWIIYDSKIENLEDAIENESRLPMLSLDYREAVGGFCQEGRHRTEIMKRIGVEEIPVFVVWDIDDVCPVEEVKEI